MTPDPNGAVPHQVHPATPRDPETNLNRTPGGKKKKKSRGRAFQRARVAATRGSAIRHLEPGSRPSRVPANLRPQGVGRVWGGAAGAARDPERWCPWVVSIPPSKGPPEIGGGGAGRGRGARIRMPSQRNPSRLRERPGSESKGPQGAGGLENSNICIRGEKQIQMSSQ